MLETINILLTMFNMCNVHLLAVNKVQIQIIIEETESGSEISSPSSRSVTMGGSCILLFLCFRDLGLHFVFEKSTKSSFYFRCFKLAIFEYKTIKTVEMRMQWIIWFVIFNLNLICILTNQICHRN